MNKNQGYSVRPLGKSRRIMAAGQDVAAERHTMYAITEADVTEPRRLIREHRERTGERLSLTAYVVACLARAVAEHPSLNSLRRRGKLVTLDDVAVITMVERDVGGEQVVEVLGIRAADQKTYRQIHDEIRAAQRRDDEPVGAVSGSRWVRLIPNVLLRTFMRAMTHNIRWSRRYGVVGVSNVGMFGDNPGWGLSPGLGTVGVTVGGIAKRPEVVDGRLGEREHLCLTLSFDHDIVDGAPAARFTSRFLGLLAGGEALRDEAVRGGFEMAVRTSKEASP